MNNSLEIVIEQPFVDQKPGTSGLRKSYSRFQEKHYLESFIESIFQILENVQGSTIIVGGDGRLGNRHAIKQIIKIAQAHGVAKVITSLDGILSTPAASNLIRKNNAVCGIILSASHNPGGLNGDFGIKLNTANGGPANEFITDSIYKFSQQIQKYKIGNFDVPDLNKKGIYNLNSLNLEIVDGVDDYLILMQQIFDFDEIKDFLASDFSFIFDGMNAVTGPYAKRIFEVIGQSISSELFNCSPLEDFGGLHPDPNLTYAKDLADLLLKERKFDFGAACDGDGDRNMILGKGCFVNPSDSLAVLTANASFVPGYSQGLAGVARSMPTSSAVDVVAKSLNIPCYETPTGWKFFGNLLDANLISICGEESFGTGSNHIREKDGLWAILFWLQILSRKKISVNELLNQHWHQFGRNFYSRHDYESIESEIANEIYDSLKRQSKTLVGKKFGHTQVSVADQFSYKDPIDGSLTTNQGIRFLLDDSSRVIVRLSGTGTKGSTLRIYFERYIKDDKKFAHNPQSILKDLIFQINQITQIKNKTGMNEPTVIT
tara:strand:+ start:658 stop:2295 length:1638 start_codon:yes stop_codon:yes gene_type:complete